MLTSPETLLMRIVLVCSMPMNPGSPAPSHHLHLAQCFREETQERFSSEAFEKELRSHHRIPQAHSASYAREQTNEPIQTFHVSRQV